MTPVLKVKHFLEVVQPLPVKYGYHRGVVADAEGFVAYRAMASSQRMSVGGSRIAARTTFVITVQTKTAEKNLEISQMIKDGTVGSEISFVSDDLRPDMTVEAGWINTIIVSVFEGQATPVQWIQFYELLEQIDLTGVIMDDNIYDKTLETSTIIEPHIENKTYHINEAEAVKAESEEAKMPRDTLF